MTLPEVPRSEPLKPLDPFRYLLGSRAAITRIAADKNALYLSAAFVAVAGLARYYDSTDLTAHPEKLLLPFASSLGITLVTLPLVLHRRIHRPPTRQAFRQLLTLVWMTAPLAVFYGIPWEHWLEPRSAANANLYTLALVALARGLILSRGIAVLTDRANSTAVAVAYTAAWPVAAIAVFATASNSGHGIMADMAGVRLPPADIALINAQIYSVLLVLVGFIGFCITAYEIATETPTDWPATLTLTPSRFPWLALLPVALLALPFLLLLPSAQKQQQRVQTLNQFIRTRNFSPAVQFLSLHVRADFPAAWWLPPTPDYPTPDPSSLDLYEAALANDAADWVKAGYLQNVRMQYFEWSYIRRMPDEQRRPLSRRLHKVLSQTGAGLRTLEEFPLDPDDIRPEAPSLLSRIFPSTTRASNEKGHP